MRPFFLGILIATLSVSFAFADDIMTGFYGNTLVAMTATSELHVHYRADHSFDAAGHSAMGPIALKGTWTLDEKNQLCRTYDAPPPGTTNPVCTPWTAHNVGDTWTINGATIKLTAGIE